MNVFGKIASKYSSVVSSKKKKRIIEIKKGPEYWIERTRKQKQKYYWKTCLNPYEIDPVPLYEFLYSPEYLDIVELSKIQMDVLSSADNDNPGTNLYTKFVMEWGKGSGKDFLSAIFFLRRVYKLYCLRNPQLYFGHDRSSIIEFLNVARNEQQARTKFFSYLVGMFERCKFLKNIGMKRRNYIEFKKRIICTSGHSDAESQEGGNLYAAVLDEISSFRTNTEIEKITAKNRRHFAKMSADQIYRVLKTSIESRFPEVGKILLLSYPRFKDDYIEVALKEARQQKDSYASGKYSTWEVNLSKTKEQIVSSQYYRERPIDAKAKYECKPPVASGAYITDKERIDQMFNKNRQSPFIGEPEAFGYFDILGVKLQPWFKPVDINTEYKIHVDLATGKIGRDAIGFAMGHLGKSVTKYQCPYCYKIPSDDIYLEYEYCRYCGLYIGRLSKGGKWESMKFPTIIIDLAFRWLARDEEQKLRFTDIVSFIIRDLKKERRFNIKEVSYDGWQSYHSIQMLEEAKLSAINCSVDIKRDAYDTFSDLLHTGRIECYIVKSWSHIDQRPISYLKWEIERLVDMGRKIDHEDGASKDITDCVAEVSRYLVESFIEKRKQEIQSEVVLPVWFDPDFM